MKVLIASTAALDHLNPLLAVANILIKHNHEVVVQTAPELRLVVEAAGVPFTPEPSATNSFTDAMPRYLELRQTKNPGLELSAFDLEYFFAKKIGGQAAGLKQALQDFPADASGSTRGASRDCASGHFAAESVQCEEQSATTGNVGERAACKT